jgi:membrane protease subunit (stomatin/prohibitin family)
MGLWDKIKGELIDIIEWTDSSGDTISHRFERYDNEIKNGAKLTVREGQVALLVNEGQLADVFQPGMYDLKTANVPILSTLKGWKHGFSSPFKAEVYFINTKMFTDQKWGTATPITLNDPRFGMFEVGAYGNYVFKVSDPETMLKEIISTDSHFTIDEITKQLKGDVTRGFTDLVGESDLPAEKFAGNLDELSTMAHEKMKPEFKMYGVDLLKFNVISISMPEEIKKEIYELSRLDKINMQAYTQLKTAKAIEKAAEQEGGMAGGGMGMGMGFAMANQMGNAMMTPQQQQQQQNQNPQQQQQQNSAPPPLPNQIAYFVAVNGQQQGPYDMNALQQQVAGGQLTRETLVWKNGMAAWTAASEVQELSNLFGSVPPPLPPQ